MVDSLEGKHVQIGIHRWLQSRQVAITGNWRCLEHNRFRPERQEQDTPQKNPNGCILYKWLEYLGNILSI